MYKQYNSLQRTQIQCQEYVDTQNMRIVIYAPDRCKFLKTSLDCQLHGNYRVFHRVEEILNEEYDGVLIVEEDVELMSTALMYFAKAIQEDVDFAFSDENYGADLETCCLRTMHLDMKTPKVAILSRKLFLTVLERTYDAGEMISLAREHAFSIKHISYILYSCRRPILESDLFLNNKKRAVILSHEFNMTGAPIVLVSAVSVLKSHGFDVVVVGPKYDMATQLFLDEGALVLVNEKRMNDVSIYAIVLHSDLVIANTVVEGESVDKLSDSPIPVIWWLHDAFMLYPDYEGIIPKRQAHNVKICAVGQHATAAMHSVRPEFKIDQLVYGLPDYSKDNYEKYNFNVDSDKVFFATVGSFETRKAQDILAKAISLLTPEELQKAVFLFVGKVYNNNVFQEVEKLLEKYPENVRYIQRLTRDEIKSLMSQCSCVVCSSTDDPMPTFVTEAAMFAKPAIVSEHTGTAGLITHGKNGFIYHNDDPHELSQVIREVIDNVYKLGEMHEESRRFYEMNFTREVFANVLGTYIEEMTNTK